MGLRRLPAGRAATGLAPRGGNTAGAPKTGRNSPKLGRVGRASSRPAEIWPHNLIAATAARRVLAEPLPPHQAPGWGEPSPRSGLNHRGARARLRSWDGGLSVRSSRPLCGASCEVGALRDVTPPHRSAGKLQLIWGD